MENELQWLHEIIIYDLYWEIYTLVRVVHGIFISTQQRFIIIHTQPFISFHMKYACIFFLSIKPLCCIPMRLIKNVPINQLNLIFVQNLILE